MERCLAGGYRLQNHRGSPGVLTTGCCWPPLCGGWMEEKPHCKEPGAGEAGVLQGAAQPMHQTRKEAPSSRTVSPAPLLAKLGMVTGGTGEDV